MATAAPLQLHPDRLLPADPAVRDVARRLHQRVRDLPVVSPHGHVPAAWLADDTPFRDPTSLLITPDHYVNRLLHSHGVDLADLGVGRSETDGPLDEAASRHAFRLLCSHWPAYRGTPVRFWLEAQLAELFGVRVRPSAETADGIYDQVAAALADDAFRPRALYDRFRIEVLATTDDPCDDLAAHRALAEDPTWHGRVVPTFRPDKYLEVGAPGWTALADRLEEVSGVDTGTWPGFLAALQNRRDYFRAHGAVSADHSHADARTDKLTPIEALDLYDLARKGELTADEATALRRHLMWEMARMSSEDGLVMTLHPGVHRDHHAPTAGRFGHDVGCDIPRTVEFPSALKPVLDDFGTHPGFRLVLFTLDETTFSREIAPLAGFYPSVFVGAPWWFLDAPDAIRRWRSTVSETVGFAKTSGFIDDTRAFCSIPARHDMARRLDAGHLAQLVAEHRLDEDEATETIVEMTTTTPRKVFRL
ncbi:glucuronate isomerase [Quadrisphaera granulorum]|uniref:Uronate isomerase n=1 Tax=Quadrisphaera granulorum TaxID=317664 RepID=A0A316ABM3_9ACTN|nr:glucuronate isomerase [Quadrisphaera granulorum]PWJ54430.1 glucuronate isomerase [Quadrisphaera granulorum]SZE96202.1 glucuronate isomerase [Quadrisphaera granulorum]